MGAGVSIGIGYALFHNNTSNSAPSVKFNSYKGSMLPGSQSQKITAVSTTNNVVQLWAQGTDKSDKWFFDFNSMNGEGTLSYPDVDNSFSETETITIYAQDGDAKSQINVDLLPSRVVEKSFSADLVSNVLNVDLSDSTALIKVTEYNVGSWVGLTVADTFWQADKRLTSFTWENTEPAKYNCKNLVIEIGTNTVALGEHVIEISGTGFESHKLNINVKDLVDMPDVVENIYIKAPYWDIEPGNADINKDICKLNSATGIDEITWLQCFEVTKIQDPPAPDGTVGAITKLVTISPTTVGKDYYDGQATVYYCSPTRTDEVNVVRFYEPKNTYSDDSWFQLEGMSRNDPTEEGWDDSLLFDFKNRFDDTYPIDRICAIRIYYMEFDVYRGLLNEFGMEFDFSRLTALESISLSAIVNNNIMGSATRFTFGNNPKLTNIYTIQRDKYYKNGSDHGDVEFVIWSGLNDMGNVGIHFYEDLDPRLINDIVDTFPATWHIDQDIPYTS